MTAITMRLLILALAACAAAHESCCEKAAEAEPEFIIDPDDAPPDVYEGEPRYVADPADTAPAAWDEDEDGPYERRLIENPRYAWAPREIENPRYRPPASLGERYADALREAAPWVALGAIVAAVLDAAPVPSFAGGLKTPGAAGVVAGALVGLATPLCSCGVLPGAAALAAEGVPLGSVVAFLTAAQSSGLDSAAITYGLLGWRAALARLLGAVVLACAAGLAVGRSAATPRKESSQRDARLDAKPLKGFGPKKVDAFAAAGVHTVADLAHFAVSDQALATKTGLPVKTVSKWRDAAGDWLEHNDSNGGGPPKKQPTNVVATALRVAAEVFPSVLVGLAVSTAALHYAPSLASAHDAYASAASGAVLRLATLAATIPLQLCEHATVTLAAGVQKGGGSAGLAFAFLLAAPATNASSLLLLAKQPSAVVRAVAALTAAALVLSYVVDAAGADLLVVAESDGGGGGGLELPGLVQGHADALVAVLAATTLYHAVRPKRHGEACGDGCKDD